MLKLKEFTIDKKVDIPRHLVDFYEYDMEGAINPVDEPITKSKANTDGEIVHKMVVRESILDSLHEVSTTGSYKLFSSAPEFQMVCYKDAVYSNVDAALSIESGVVYYPKAKGTLVGSTAPAVIARVLRHPSNGQVKLLVYESGKLQNINPKRFNRTGEAASKEWAIIDTKMSKLVKQAEDSDDDEVEEIIQPKRTAKTSAANKTKIKRKADNNEGTDKPPLKKAKTMQNELQKLKDQEEQLTKELHDMSQKVVKLTNKLNTAYSKVSEYNGKLKRLENELADTQHTLTQAQGDLQNAIDSTRNERQLHEKEIKNLQTDLEQKRQQLNETMSIEEKKTSVAYYPVAVPMPGHQYPAYPAPHPWPQPTGNNSANHFPAFNPMNFYPHFPK